MIIDFSSDAITALRLALEPLVALRYLVGISTINRSFDVELLDLIVKDGEYAIVASNPHDEMAAVEILPISAIQRLYVY